MTKSANKPKFCVSGSGEVKQHKKDRHVVKDVRNIARPDFRYTQLKRVSISLFTAGPICAD